MRLLFREGLAKDGQATGTLAEPLQADRKGSAVERIDGRRIGLNTRPVDAVTLLWLHRRHCPSNAVTTQQRQSGGTPLPSSPCSLAAADGPAVLDIGTEEVLFDWRYHSQNSPMQFYDLHPDGQRFPMITTDRVEPKQINVALNWFEELERLVPVH
jgi:hypothetical protein